MNNLCWIKITNAGYSSPNGDEHIKPLTAEGAVVDINLNCVSRIVHGTDGVTDIYDVNGKLIANCLHAKFVDAVHKATAVPM